MSMGTVAPLTSFAQIKLLADTRRLEILRLLMAAPASLTGLGAALGEHPAWIRHHIKRLEEAGLVEVCEVKVTNGVTEKFYRARAGAFLIQEMVLPQEGDRPTVIFSGSHDLAIEHLVEQLSPYINLLTLPVGSLDGLVALRQGFCHLSGCHLLDADGEYNAPFVRRFFPDRQMTLITLAYRQQGLMLAPGNPKGLRGIPDLVRPDVTFANRQRGSGTRLWLDGELQRLGIPATSVRGYENDLHTHTACAEAIKRGAADAALGLQAAARAHGLDFIPLFHERYDLALPHEQASTLAPILDHLQSADFRRAAAALSGYDTAHTGEQIPL
jgi:putative molybdopterin biosynthesis protein